MTTAWIDDGDEERPDRDAVHPHRPTDVEGQPLDGLVAGVGPGARDHGAGEQDRRCRGRRSTCVVAGHTMADATARGDLVVGEPGPLVQHGRSPDQQHRDEEVEAHDRVVELGEGDGRTDQDLGDHARHEEPRPTGQVAPTGHAEHGPADGEDDGDRDGAGEEPVDPLDHGVELEWRVELALLAGGPVAAAQPRAGEPHRSARDDDAAQRQRARRA